MAAGLKRPIADDFQAMKVKDLVPKDQKVIVLNHDDSLDHAVKVLRENKISSAPVVGKDGKPFGFADMVGIANYIHTVVPKGHELTGDELSSLEIAGRAISLVTMEQVLAARGSKHDPLVEVYLESDAKQVLDLFANGAHRCAVLDKAGGKIVNIVSQSDLVRVLSEVLPRGESKTIAARTLKEVGLCSADASSVVSISADKRVLAALHKMCAQNVACLAITAEGGRLTGNFSAADVKGLYQEKLPGLLETIEDYMENYAAGSMSPTVAKDDTTLLELVNQFVESKLHRLWVVDDKFCPISLISLTSICKVALNAAL